MGGLAVDAGEGPFLGRGEGELEENVLEFDIPLGLLPVFVPPGTGERKGAAGFANGALMRAGQQGKRVEEAATFFGGDIDGDGRALPVEGKKGGRMAGGANGELEIRRDGVELKVVGAMTVEDLRDAELAGADDAGESFESVGELIGVLEPSLEELVLGVVWEGRKELEMEFQNGSGGGEAVEVGVKSAQEGVGCQRGFGEGEVSGVGGSVIEAESEVDFGSGALVVF